MFKLLISLPSTILYLFPFFSFSVASSLPSFPLLYLPLVLNWWKKKKEKISRETSASPEDHQATARPHSTREAAWPPVTPSHTSSPVTKPQQISPGSLTGLGLGTRTGEKRPLGSTTQSSPTASICCVAPDLIARETSAGPVGRLLPGYACSRSVTQGGYRGSF